jgi:hypothetical protein
MAESGEHYAFDYKALLLAGNNATADDSVKQMFLCMKKSLSGTDHLFHSLVQRAFRGER